MPADIFQHADLPFPQSLPDFQRPPTYDGLVYLNGEVYQPKEG